MGCLLVLPVFDKGTSLEFTVRDCGGTPDAEGVLPLVDLTDATTITVVFRKSDDAETVITRTGVIHEDYTGPDGIVQYITEGTEIDTIGMWKAEVVVGFANMTPPAEHTSTEVDIDVVATLRNPAE